MANIKAEKKSIYISKSLSGKLSLIENYTSTFVNAPTGYGKTTVLKNYFNSSDYRVLWIDAYSSQDFFWQNLCAAVESFNPEFAIQIGYMGIPTTEKELSMIVSLLRKISYTEKTALIIDDYYLAENEINDRIFSTLINSTIDNLKIIFISRTISSNHIVNLILRDKIGNIDKESFKYKPEDIIEYFRLNELIISEKEAKRLYDYSDGWPFVVRLQLLSYASKKSLNALDSINTFIKNDIWRLTSEKEKSFLIKTCLFDEFTISQAIDASELPSTEVIELLDYNEHINYNYEKSVYCINPLFLKYIREVFLDLSTDIKKSITVCTGKLYEKDNKYFSAICCYHSVKDYESIYMSRRQLNDLYGFIIKENKYIFLDIANNYGNTDKNGQYEFAIILSFILFLYNELQMMESLIILISNDINNDKLLSEGYQTKLQGELAYVSAYCKFNNISKMNSQFMKVYDLIKEPLNLIAGQVPFSLGSPSILTLYHNECGMLDTELSILEHSAPNYYRITNGHGKGFEAVMKAEILYNRGEFEGAEILCHKAMYMAFSRNQNSIYICALLILSKLAICNGNNDAFIENLNEISKKINDDTSNHTKLNTTVDISKSFLYATIGDKNNISTWLKDDKLIEDSTNFITLSYANIIYGKYLILNKQYHHFLGISGQFIGLTKVFSNIFPRIYTYIYLAIANNEVNEYQKSRKFLMEAIKISVKDNIYMPFVENYGYIENLFDETNSGVPISDFIKNIKKLARNYSKGLKVIQKINKNSANFGLTNRETEIAKLAAQRLSNKEIADRLFIAESTVKSNMKMIFNKLTINTRTDLKNFFN